LRLPLLPHDEHYIHVNGAVLVTLFIVIVAFLANRALKGRIEENLVPSPKPSVMNAVDVLVEGLFKMVHDTIGHHGEKYFPMIATLFIFVLFCNLLGLLPHSSAPTANLNTTLGLGAAVFFYYNWMGIREHGIINYGKHFLMGMGFMGVPIAAFELLSHVLRPFTLGLRLFLNMTIDHLLAGSFASLVAWIVPVPLLLFGVVVCTIQAFLFATLTSVYLQMATEHEEH
jgi:F-type H+-transporting ATPase subunit a